MPGRLQRRQTLQASKIKMVIMRMRDDKGIDFRQGLGGISRRHHTFWATECERRRAVREQRICQHANAFMPEQKRGMPDPGHIPANHISRRNLRRIKQRHPILFGRTVLAGQEGTGKAKNVEQPLVVAIACRMLEPVSGFVILRRMGLGLHGTASCQKMSGDKQRDKETRKCRHMANPGIG